MMRRTRNSRVFCGLIWLTLALSVAISADVVEDLLFEAPDFFVAEKSNTIPVPESEDFVPNVWITPSVVKGQASLLIASVLALPVAVAISFPPITILGSDVHRAAAAIHPSLSLPPLRL